MLPRPVACYGCRHFHGQTYGSVPLICGSHPYGWQGDTCPDHQAFSPDCVVAEQMLRVPDEVLRELITHPVVRVSVSIDSVSDAKIQLIAQALGTLATNAQVAIAVLGTATQEATRQLGLACQGLTQPAAARVQTAAALFTDFYTSATAAVDAHAALTKAFHPDPDDPTEACIDHLRVRHQMARGIARMRLKNFLARYPNLVALDVYRLLVRKELKVSHGVLYLTEKGLKSLKIRPRADDRRP